MSGIRNHTKKSCGGRGKVRHGSVRRMRISGNTHLRTMEKTDISKSHKIHQCIVAEIALPLIIEPLAFFSGSQQETDTYQLYSPQVCIISTGQHLCLKNEANVEVPKHASLNDNWKLAPKLSQLWAEMNMFTAQSLQLNFLFMTTAWGCFTWLIGQNYIKLCIIIGVADLPHICLTVCAAELSA